MNPYVMKLNNLYASFINAPASIFSSDFKAFQNKLETTILRLDELISILSTSEDGYDRQVYYNLLLLIFTTFEKYTAEFSCLTTENTRAYPILLKHAMLANLYPHSDFTDFFSRISFNSIYETIFKIQGCDFNTTDEFESVALHYASLTCSVDIINKLIQIPGIQIHLKSIEGATALHAAACSQKRGKEEREQQNKTIRILLDAGIDPNVKDANGDSALLIAAEKTLMRGKFSLINTLLSHPVTDPNLCNNDNNSALYYLFQTFDSNKSRATLELLFSHPRFDFNLSCNQPDFICQRLSKEYASASERYTKINKGIKPIIKTMQQVAPLRSALKTSQPFSLFFHSIPRDINKVVENYIVGTAFHPVASNK